MAKFIIQPHVRLQEWIAEEKGYFKDEGLDYEFQAASFAGATHPQLASTVQTTETAPAEVKSGAFEDMSAGRACDVSSACHWAVNAASVEQHGRMWGHAYSISPSGIFVAPESPIRTPKDLAGVEVGVGYHSGSHFSALQELEPLLPRDQIKLRFIGLPWDRVRLAQQRQIQAVNVFGAQYYVLEQLGFRKVVDTTFMMGFLIAPNADMTDIERYFRALRRAQRDLDLEPERYKQYWAREVPEDLRSQVEVMAFGPGERIVFEPYTPEMFEQTHRWMRTWDLFPAEQAERARYEEAVLA